MGFLMVNLVLSLTLLLCRNLTVQVPGFWAALRLSISRLLAWHSWATFFDLRYFLLW